MIAYAQKFEYSLSDLDLNLFRGAVNFYLNGKFNLNNLLIFTQYLTATFNSRIQQNLQGRSLSQLSEDEQRAVYEKVLANTEDLVDMRLMFALLVDKIGDKQAVDPISKEDNMWLLIDFFTKTDFL